MATLTGSAIYTECLQGDSWINYRVVATAPDGGDIAADAVLLLGTGTRTVSVPLGTLRAGELTGQVRWPRDAQQDPAPVATLRLEPSIASPLAVPISGEACDPADPAAAALAVTGQSPWVPAIAAGGAVVLVAGVLLSVLRRRRRV
ncbi:hypothetical protein ACTU3I_13080 [Microbacterium sp. RD1]|uniref:hypothetical protein n=1 Tax=Microbacterium sp. RD1 TaxID=3457313 RepID=UPI003FA61466